MTQLEKITLKNVAMSDGTEQNLTVEVVPFNRRNDDHVDFALAYSDMLAKLPSPFKTVTDAAVRAVELFMVHKEEDANDINSPYYAVHADKRAARILFNTSSTLQKSIFDFFENA